MKILAWPAFSNKKSNPYQFRLYTEISRSHTVEDVFFRPRDLLGSIFHRYDIIHIHWLERVLWGRVQSRIPVRMLCFAVSIWLLRLKGTRVVWTVHDADPHAMAENERLSNGLLRILWPWYKSIAIRAIDGLIFLSSSHREALLRQYPPLLSLPYAIIPHSHYRGVYPSSISRSNARTHFSLESNQFAFVFVGKIRPYKNVDGLIRSFQQVGDPDACLIVAGEPDTETYARGLRELSSLDSRVHLTLRFIPDDELQLYLHAADVVVIPFNECTNSGSVLLVLSFDCLVAVPDLPVFQELREIVGQEWVYLFGGSLTGEELGRIRQWAASKERTGSAPLESLNWGKAAAKTIEFYKVLGNRPRR
jgi:beta-1,4-mannosyltransferase